MPFYYNGTLGNGGSGGGGGTNNYNDLEESTLPKINNVIIKGDLSLQDLGIEPEAILDVPSLPVSDIKDNVFYRITKQGYNYDNKVFINDADLTCYSFDSTITIDDNGLTDTLALDALLQPTTYTWDALTDAIIASLGNRITEVDFVSDNQHFCRYGNNSYNIATKFVPTNIYELYFYKNGSWTLVVDTNESTSYSSLVGLPRIDNNEIIGNRSSDDYGINKVITETEYNNLPSGEKNNNYTYFIDGDGTGSIDQNFYINYNNNINKPSINGIILQQGLLASDLDLYTRSEVDAKFSGVYSYKGVVADISSLPSASVSNVGDVYYVTAETASYAFNGSLWQSIGGVVDLSNYQLKQDNALLTTSKTIVGGINELYNNKVNTSDIVDNLTSTSTTAPLSANQGRELNSKVELRELLSNKTTTIDNNSTDTEYPSAKSVYDGFAPRGSTFIAGTYQQLFRNVNDAVFNFDITGDEIRQIGQQKFCVSNVLNPISGSQLFGFCETKIEANNHTGNGSKVYIYQTVEAMTDDTMIFKRKGTLPGPFDCTKIYENRASITWGAWCPYEYPCTNVTINSTNFSSGSVKFTINGGTLLLHVDGIGIASGQTGTLVLCELPVLPFKPTANGADRSYVRSAIVNVTQGYPLLLHFDSGNSRRVSVFGVTQSTGGWYGEMSIPLVY